MTKLVAAAMLWSTFMGLSLDRSARVDQVRRFSYAHVVGFKTGDTILQVNGTAVKSLEEFEATARNYLRHAPQTWTFQVAREGVAEAITIQSEPGYPCDPLTLNQCGPLPK